MKTNKSFSISGLSAKAVFVLLALAVSFASCSDKIYEEINTDPTKADHVNPASQLTYAELQMYGDMNYVDVHRRVSQLRSDDSVRHVNTTVSA